MAKRVSRNSRISRSWDAWIRGKLALKMLDLDSVMSPMSPAFGLQPPRKQMKMGMFPGSSTVEHKAVNRRVASSNLARGAKILLYQAITEFGQSIRLATECLGLRSEITIAQV